MTPRPPAELARSAEPAGSAAGPQPRTLPKPRSPLQARKLRQIEEACQLIEAEEEPLSLGELGRRLGLSPWSLHRAFRKALGVTPQDYAQALRQRRFRGELKQGTGIAEATYAAGFGSSSRVYERAALELGMTPSRFAKGGQGERIAYAVSDSPLGLLLVASTGRGVCFVALGETEAELLDELAREFPEAERVRDQDAIQPALQAVVAHLEGELPDVRLPLDVRATAFQRRVWQEILAIPPGEVRSYSEIAERLGMPKAARAVGAACAANPVALIIPCHRVLRQDESLAGYRWGTERKKRLLEGEFGRVLA